MTHTIETLRARCEEIGECWEWTGSHTRNGHPTVTNAQKHFMVRRLMAELSGMPLTPKKKISTKCGNKSCVCPQHIVIETHRQLMKRQGAMGKLSGQVRHAKIAAAKRAGPQAKITMEIARSIRESDAPHTTEAKKHGITPRKVADIRNYLCWREFESNPWMGLGARA